ncbi:MAG: MBL fold metallo-hydrolase [Candidatus Omnitrophica bacterium]|nr:MBL fold metallo-hydrolase [Candidatus Omnitrophota bacterium]
MAEIKTKTGKASKKASSKDFIKFLGTAGARFVMIEQLRSSGGIWISYKGAQIMIDPGPGALVRCAASKPRLNPLLLDGVILTHRHLDHSGDVNVMIEAMTEGGFKRKGVVFCPEDAIAEDTVILRHVTGFPEKIEILKPESTYSVKTFSFTTAMRHVHPVETYGFKTKLNNTSIGFLCDTRYFAGLIDFYKELDVLVLYVVFVEPRPGVDHLSLFEAEQLISELRPKKVILTHFGMSMLKAKPHFLAEDLTQRLGIEVVAAYDGMTFPV